MDCWRGWRIALELGELEIEMKCLFVLFGLSLLLLTGCATPILPAVVEGGIIQNPTIGWSGYVFKIPEGMELVDLLTCPLEEGGEIEKVAVRLMQRSWGERQRSDEWSWERFGEAFSFQGSEEKTFVLLGSHQLSIVAPMPMFGQLLPSEKRRVYNFCTLWKGSWGKTQAAKMGGHQALYSSGFAYEKNGIVYKNKIAGSRPVFCVSCVVLGNTRDAYELLGVSAPEDASLLRYHMQAMIDGFSFP